MHFSLLSTFCLVGCVLGEKLSISFDKSLEGRIGIQKVVEEVRGELSLESKRKPKLDRPGNGIEGHLDSRDLLGFSPADNLVDRAELVGRQYSCDAGYGYCADFGRCCPDYSLCCSYGYCIEAEQTCCPNGPCRAGEECCGTDNCMEAGAACCLDGSHCPAGNDCYIVAGYSDMRCCTNSRCTAYVDESGSTTSADVTTSTRTLTTTSSQYYYWTVTWSYWYYYWSYEVRYSYVTSEWSTTSSTFSVQTTDSEAAEEYFSSLSDEVTLPTPAAATSLASLAGETSFVESTTADEPTATTEAEANNEEQETGDGGGGNNGGIGDGNGNGNGGIVGDDGDDGGSAASRLLGSVDRFTTLFLSFSVAIGVTAVWL